LIFNPPNLLKNKGLKSMYKYDNNSNVMQSPDESEELFAIFLSLSS